MRLLMLLLLPLAALAGEQTTLNAGGVREAQAWYEAVLAFVLRPGLAAVLTGFLLALVIPQRVKMDFPVDWSDSRRRFMTRLVSFASGFTGTALIWPLFWPWDRLVTTLEVYGVLISGFLASILVGALAPWSYTVVMNRLYRLGWLNEERWSGEARARAKAADRDAGIDQKPTQDPAP